MKDLVATINNNQGVLAIAIFILGAIGTFLWRVLKKDSIYSHSPSIVAGGNISAGGDITVGNHSTRQTIINNNNDIPEIHLQLYGAGSKKTIEGHVEKKGDRTLVLETIEINGNKTEFNQQFTKLVPVNSLNFSESLFTTKTAVINARVIYRTLDGKRYELNQTMDQSPRVDGFFNISLVGAPIIKSL